MRSGTSDTKASMPGRTGWDLAAGFCAGTLAHNAASIVPAMIVLMPKKHTPIDLALSLF
jgi:hypothetical protein